LPFFSSSAELPLNYLNFSKNKAGISYVSSKYIRYSLGKVLIYMADDQIAKKISVNSTISLKGIVKAIFNDTVHVQIGGKIIPIPASDFKLEK